MVKLVDLDYDEMFWDKWIEPEGRIEDTVQTICTIENELQTLLRNITDKNSLSYRDIIKFKHLEYYLHNSRCNCNLDKLDLVNKACLLMWKDYRCAVESFNKDCLNYGLKELWDLEEKINEY